ncbi:hypothetical protein RDWZM_007871 [Blomia tropicalis]|uniref:enoyl-CoA hydratase n=1 Tax=Blomia tropicalis TaxID=40697 RepID=A0A9Q0RJF9_BLOTA|nr:hypothetical protein RDWZM_007871 [Blomia tropicalis]
MNQLPKRILSINQWINGKRLLSSSKSYEFIKKEIKGIKENVSVITFNRPDVLNALSFQLINEVDQALKEADNDPRIAASIITGSGKAFAAGADLKQLQKMSYPEMAMSTRNSSIDELCSKKPIIAAVNGLAFGGGCELAMRCDIIYASEKALFGQPEIKVGLIPGAGGTQRLTRIIGKSKTMEMCLTGRPITASEALSLGLISKVVSPDQLLDEAIKLAEEIGNQSKFTVHLCKESINSAYETTLKEGMNAERRFFNMCIASNDRTEGIAAFIEKRKPNFTDS